MKKKNPEVITVIQQQVSGPLNQLWITQINQGHLNNLQ